MIYNLFVEVVTGLKFFENLFHSNLLGFLLDMMIFSEITVYPWVKEQNGEQSSIEKNNFRKHTTNSVGK